MNFSSNDLNLPVFLLSRNRLKYHLPGFMPKYIRKHRNLLTRCCNEENETETATKAYQKHLMGLYPPSKGAAKCKLTSGSKDQRSLIDSKAWQLPPNLYDVPVVILKKFKGAGGAHWAKLPKKKFRRIIHVVKKVTKPQWKFYDYPREMDRFQRPCYKYKGIFVSNARTRRPSTRSMVDNLVTCYRFPSDPGPTRYVPTNHELRFHLRMPYIKQAIPNPHLFLQKSCVPLKVSSYHKKNISFAPAPGRYENRFKGICPCTCKRIYYPDIHLAIEHEKRLKFRRQPYKKIKLRLFCSPNWRHVVGRGHTYLFKEPRSKKRKIKSFRVAKKLEKTLQLYPDSRYISLITNPTTYEPQSIRSAIDPYIMFRPNFRYNCIVKRVMRKQLRNNKKIAFNSGQKRFKDDVRPMPLTMTQMERIKQNLPLERQLRDQPIMRKNASQIKSQLMPAPNPNVQIVMRKPTFKFLPLPRPKVLVTIKDTEPDTTGGTGDGMDVYKPTPFFGKPVNAIDFLRPGTTLDAIEPRKSISD